MDIRTTEYAVWNDGAVIHFEGTMRLSGAAAYAPIQSLMDEVLASGASLLTLDLTGLEFLNSSGINLLAKFTIEVRKRPEIALAIRGTTRIPWQSKSLPNLKKLHPAVDLTIV
ncbi:slr1659 superfamily regulator [Acidisoma sp. C75]